MHTGSFINTEAPMTLFGAFPNYYTQRIRSWDMGMLVFEMCLGLGIWVC